MGVAKSIFTTVSGLYNNINPITLSGVNDVIVVKSSSGELKCSPFQLRFSKLKFTSSRNQVHILVNGKLTDITMSITSQGDLFFEQEMVSDLSGYEMVVNYLQSNEALKNSIIQDLFINRIFSEAELNEISKVREENLKKRMLSKNFIKHQSDNMYSELLKTYNRFNTMICSSENYQYLLKNSQRLTVLLERLMTKLGSPSCPTVTFSICMNTKIDQSYDTIFSTFLVKNIESPENTVVKIEDNEGLNQVFFLSFSTFSRLYFELLSCKNKKSKTVEFLEKEFNKSLGWNFFKSKKPLKRDVSFSLTLSSKELEMLNLNPGKNDVVFKIGGSNQQLEASIYLWDENDKIIVSDIDGTITKSDVKGHLYSLVGKDWTHSGIAPLYTKLVKNGYRIIYLTSRPLGQSYSTKNYLNQISQDKFSLPQGPVIHNPDGIFRAVYKEVILKKPEDFKIDCLNQIKQLFNEKNPFLAGFGNRITDVITYKAMKIPENRIYTVNAYGQIQAEYSKASVGTYHTINEFIDSIFPPINYSSQKGLDYSYSDFKWWK